MMKNNPTSLFIRNTFIAYFLLGAIFASYMLTEKSPDIHTFGKVLIVGGGIISLITVWIVFKPTSRSHRHLSLTNFSTEYFLKKRAEDKPMEFIAFSVLLACLLVALTGYFLMKYPV
jgi:hypothetical protein